MLITNYLCVPPVGCSSRVVVSLIRLSNLLAAFIHAGNDQVLLQSGLMEDLVASINAHRCVLPPGRHKHKPSTLNSNH